MPRLPGKVPSYCRHKASGRAVVRIDGKDFYLGEFGSEESFAEYERLIGEWRVSRTRLAVRPHLLSQTATPALTVAELLLQYREFARGYYSKDGSPTKEYVEMGLALRPVRELFANLLARDFGPLALQAVRQHMIEQDLSRGVINNRIHRIKRCFRWAVSEERVPPSVYEGLRAVPGLKKYRSTARETDPVQPVPDEDVEAVLPHVAPQVAAMIRLQRLTGMRPGEAVLMRSCEIDRTQDVWMFTPADHKNAWRGHDRQIPLGPKAQEILLPFLHKAPSEFLFSPRDAEAHRNSLRRAGRKTPMTPSQRNRCSLEHPGREKRNRYDVDSYRRAIKYGIIRVNKIRAADGLPLIPHWFPLQIRHSRATELNESFGIEAAAVTLGHAHADTTKIYAERNLKLAREIARKSG